MIRNYGDKYTEMRVYKHGLVLPPASLELLESLHDLWITVSLSFVEKRIEVGFLSNTLIL